MARCATVASRNGQEGSYMTLSRAFWMNLRQALLMVVNSLEQELGLEPRTSELRKWWKEQRKPERS